MNMTQNPGTFFDNLPASIRAWAQELGFSDAGITYPDTGVHGERLKSWLAEGYQGEMAYMGHHGDKRYTPTALVPGTLRVISVRMDYLAWPDSPKEALTDRERAYVTRYALGRDYHKLMRKRLATLAGRIDDAVSGYEYRAFVDSAPVLERALAQRAGLGWIGKNNMVIHPKAGSFFFLGEIIFETKFFQGRTTTQFNTVMVIYTDHFNLHFVTNLAHIINVTDESAR